MNTMDVFDSNMFGNATNEQGVDMSIVWIYRNILRDGGSVTVIPDPVKPNKFKVYLYSRQGTIEAVTSLPGDGVCLTVSHIRSHLHRLKYRSQ